jgi:hypothetical protein
VRTHPYADAVSDFTPANSFAKALAEEHEVSLHPAKHGGLLPDKAKERNRGTFATIDYLRF